MVDEEPLLLVSRRARTLVSSWCSQTDEGRARVDERVVKRAAKSGVNEAALMERILGEGSLSELAKGDLVLMLMWKEKIV